MKYSWEIDQRSRNSKPNTSNIPFRIKGVYYSNNGGIKQNNQLKYHTKESFREKLNLLPMMTKNQNNSVEQNWTQDYQSNHLDEMSLQF